MHSAGLALRNLCKEATMNQESYSTGSMVQEKQKEKRDLSVHFFYIEEF